MANTNTVKSHIPSHEQMLAAGMHLGRKPSVFDPHMKPYIYTTKDGLYIIDLIKTSESLINAVTEIKNIIDGGGQVLFVGLTKQSAEGVKKLADELDMPYVQERWVGGTLSNFKVVIERVKYLKEMGEKLKSGALDKYTKKERLKFERDLGKMEKKFGGLRKLTKLPDLVFVTSTNNSMVVVKEANKIGIKIAGITNTDGNPTLLDYAIPASDSSRKSIELIFETISKAVKK